MRDRGGAPTVVVATDGSVEAHHAAETACGIVGHDASYVLVHAVPPLPTTSPSGRFVVGSLDPLREADDKAGQRTLHRAAMALPVEVEPELVRGLDPAAAILEVAERRDAAVIVVGSRGLGALRRAVLGSVSTTVVHESNRPVLVVPNPDPDGDAE